MQKLLVREPPAKVAVFRALQLGDMLCAVPALRALRAVLPRTHITLVGLPWAREFVKRFPQYLDGFLESPGYPGLPERTPRLASLAGFLNQAQSLRFDLAIQMHGNGVITNPLTVLLGARSNAGFFQIGGYCPDSRNFMPYPEAGAETRRLLHLTEFLGAPTQGEALEFPVHEDDVMSLHGVPESAGLMSRDYVCVHPGARSADRRWGAERFAAVADALADQGLRVVLTGSRAERALAAVTACAMRAPSINLAGRTDLGALAALLRNARLLVCNDTGVAHLAEALQVPSVTIFVGTKSDPERWGPLTRDLHQVVACMDGKRMTSPAPSQVIVQAKTLLQQLQQKDQTYAA